MKSKKKVGLKNLNPNLVLRIANLSNLKFTETAKLNLTNKNRTIIREQKIKEKINNLKKKSRELQNKINEAKNEDRVGRAYMILQNKEKIDNTISILKKKI